MAEFSRGSRISTEFSSKIFLSSIKSSVASSPRRALVHQYLELKCGPQNIRSSDSPVSRDHLFNDHPRHIDVGDRGVSLVEHVLAQPRVTTSHHEDVVILTYVLGNCVLQARVALCVGGGELIPTQIAHVAECCPVFKSTVISTSRKKSSQGENIEPGGKVETSDPVPGAL